MLPYVISNIEERSSYIGVAFPVYVKWKIKLNPPSCETLATIGPEADAFSVRVEARRPHAIIIRTSIILLFASFSFFFAFYEETDSDYVSQFRNTSSRTRRTNWVTPDHGCYTSPVSSGCYCCDVRCCGDEVRFPRVQQDRPGRACSGVAPRHLQVPSEAVHHLQNPAS